MRSAAVAGCSRRMMCLVVVVVLAVLGVLAEAPLGTAPRAYAATDNWFMIVNDYYDGTYGHGDGTMRCLSANMQASPSGPGTHYVYLTPCNQYVPAQWWHIELNAPDLAQYIDNWLMDDEDYVWQLSSNKTKPPGGFEGTYAVYTARNSTAEGHYWKARGWYSQYKFRLQSMYSLYEMSASHNYPYDFGGYQVFVSPYRTTPAAQQLWRQYQPAGGPPDCYHCATFMRSL